MDKICDRVVSQKELRDAEWEIKYYLSNRLFEIFEGCVIKEATCGLIAEIAYEACFTHTYTQYVIADICQRKKQNKEVSGAKA